MRLRNLVTVSIVAAAVGGAIAAFAAGDPLRTRAAQILGPLPKDASAPERPLSPERVALGRALFFDPRMSADGTVSCSRCHLAALYGTDALSLPRGAEDRLNPRNVPTVLNAALQTPVHWRGDRKDVEDQAMQALIGHVSFGNPDYASAMTRLKALPAYVEQFHQAFPAAADPVTPVNWGLAVGAFERTLVTPGRFDTWLGGDDTALSTQEKAGLAKFMELGCAACHRGPAVGGNAFFKFGLFGDYWKATGSREIDRGRIDVTGNASDLYVFKVPILRNVAMTPPYFHDGSVAKLDDAVRIMARLQLNRGSSDGDVADLVAFLGSLTGELPSDFATAPILPSGPYQAAEQAAR